MARKKRPIKMITLDTETYNGLIGGLKKIAIYDGEKIEYGNKFEDIEPFLKKYYLDGFDVHVYIHNIEFDARKIPVIFDEKHIVWEKCFVINGKLATIKNKYWTFHDSFKILPKSLHDLSEDFNVKHGKLSLFKEIKKQRKDYIIYNDKGQAVEQDTIVNFLDKCPINDELFIEYLGYDVMSLYEILEILMKVSHVEQEVFVKKISTASLSRHIFKTGFNGHEFRHDGYSLSDYEMMCSYKWQNGSPIEEFIRCSYCGGRTEVFKPLLDHLAFHYDINSMYPFVMYCKEYPIGKPEFYSDSDIAKEYFENWLVNHEGLGFISATVDIPKCHIPPLPVKMGKLTFPTGKVHGTWTYTELEFAIKNCGVKVLKYREVCHFNRTFPVFENFIDSMWTIKQEGKQTGNNALAQFGKLLMNVGYGYTGMNRDKTALISIDKLDGTQDVVYINSELGYAEVKADVKSEYIQVQIASYVTSYARLELLKMLLYSEKHGNVYYCDTDSIVTDVQFPSEILDKIALGKWDIEGKPKFGLFIMPKVYCETDGEKVTKKFKGVSKSTQAEYTIDDYKKFYKAMADVKEKDITVERNKIVMRSIMYMEKTDTDFLSYEIRDKKMNLTNMQKRKMFYKENYTEPHHFENENEPQDFYKIKKRVNINEILRGNKNERL